MSFCKHSSVVELIPTQVWSNDVCWKSMGFFCNVRNGRQPSLASISPSWSCTFSQICSQAVGCDIGIEFVVGFCREIDRRHLSSWRHAFCSILSIPRLHQWSTPICAVVFPLANQRRNPLQYLRTTCTWARDNLGHPHYWNNIHRPDCSHFQILIFQDPLDLLRIRSRHPTIKQFVYWPLCFRI